MKKFMDENFLLETETAKKLYFEYAAPQPIIDYHCHLSIKEICEDKHFSGITELWLGGDHYKWRFMRSMGVDEKFITGDASDYEKFLAYARSLQYAVGNPLYHWSHLELQRYFGIYEPLTEKTAKDIYEKCNQRIAEPDFSARQLIIKSNVAFIGTTDDPADDMSLHESLKKEGFPVRVSPTFRPDKSVNIEKPDFADYIKKLADRAGMAIHSYDELKQALSLRLDAFGAVGCCCSDHALGTVPFNREGDPAAAFAKALAGETPDAKEIECYKTDLLLWLGAQYANRGWVMQLHLAALRDNNSRMFKKLGPDTGFDSIDDGQIAYTLSRLMDTLDMNDALPKTILYTLNPKDNFVLGTMLGNFQRDVKGKIQFGSGWWFNDHIDGMVEQMRALGNLGALAAFVGMLTDSRSFLSYPRHEYFRRIMCNLIGNWVENGEFTDDEDILKTIVCGISADNAKAYFGLE
ncbi:MAG: glucuronate isomerase [Clostridia bacterium]|nr:glucuronate isomerase [Clostridia bacterium]